MSKQAFEAKIAAVENLRSDPANALEPVRKALRDRNNYVVSKAAGVCADLRLEEAIPDLEAAFGRFLEDAVKTDPKCWAKEAIVKALKDLAHRNPHVFLKGLTHFQLEPVYGGKSDSAATLRGACALALVDSQLGDLEILTHLTDRLADPEKPVRLDAAVAIAQMSRPEGALILRMKALAGDAEPEVTGQCFTSLLTLDLQGSIDFVRRFLDREQDSLEAGCALAQSRSTDAVGIVKDFWKRKLPIETRRAILISLGASPLREAAELLLSFVSSETKDLAKLAAAALSHSRFHHELREQLSSAMGELGE